MSEILPMSDLWQLTAAQLLDGYRTRAFRRSRLPRAMLERIDELNPKLNAFNLISDRAKKKRKHRKRAGCSGMPKGLLDGVPVSIKDIILTKGWPTLRGSKTVDPKGPWNDDAPATARLREHGAVLLGKTTTPEFGWKGVTDSPLTGITRNPWNPAKTPGGSSGGAAAAVAAGMGPLAVGTDGGGSIRIPCCFTGLFGIKASFGRVPAWPLSPFGTVAHVGPITRTVTDAALMLNVLAQPDARDWHALPYDPRDWRMDLEQGVRDLRIAWSPNLGYAKVDPEVAFHRARTRSRCSRISAPGSSRSIPASTTRGRSSRRTGSAAPPLLLRGVKNKEPIDPGLLEVAAQGEKIGAARAARRAAEARRARRAHEPVPSRLRPAPSRRRSRCRRSTSARSFRRPRAASAGPTGRRSPTRST